MKTFLAIALVLSIAFSLFALNNDISEQSNVNTVRLAEAEQVERSAIIITLPATMAML